ncbi:SDR family oxidoreductase [Limnobacter humi]|uniref:SDR family oxidoreductase n=1 Tax=Limnobacter humi TaxID=1778671 RepID=A0ABT1WGX4_9BURK|nr:SDR family oxidoreductase [Limnobacter humi]MCQ8896775.1 SDR family oxidoreductase [Limnobacter humi]
MKNFKDKVVVITGAASGMGRAYALMFAREGSHLALCDYAADGLAETVRLTKVQTPGVRIHSAVVDVSNKSTVEAFADDVKNALGPACVVINNAGVSGEGAPVWAMSDHSYERVMGINFWGVVYGTRAFLPQLMSQKQGAIVNVSSVFGLVGTPNNSDYCASKFAVRGFTESLAVELSSSDIQVHLVHPGGINTNIASEAKHEKFAKKFLTTPPEDMVDQVRKGILKNEPRIVYGNNAARIWWGSRFLPFKKMRHVLWQQMKPALDPAPYKDLK